MPELAGLVQVAYQVFVVLILARVILSWVPGLGSDHPAVRLVHRLTSPVLDPIRRLLPPVGGLDLSPLVAVMLLHLARNLLVDVLLAL